MFAKRNRRMLGFVVTGLVAVALCAGCGEEDKGGLPTEEVAAGWNHFQQGAFESAIASFSAAAAKAPGWGEPYSGLGWSYASLDSVTRAQENFELAVAKGPTLTDAWAGLAIVSLVLEEYQAGGLAAMKALELGLDKYTFRYDDEVNARALRIVYAECAYYLGDYATAEEQVELVSQEFLLDPADPDYVERLLEVIGNLSRQ
jgi:tetratricopeptide (TPR) repeat protein